MDQSRSVFLSNDYLYILYRDFSLVERWAAICKLIYQQTASFIMATHNSGLEYLSILERFLCIHSVPAAPQYLAYQYKTREMEILWHEFLTFIIPLLNTQKIVHKINKCLPTSKGSISSDVQTYGICAIHLVCRMQLAANIHRLLTIRNASAQFAISAWIILSCWVCEGYADRTKFSEERLPELQIVEVIQI
uniref:Uncharacterized protein n=1 Tax=Strigamia maritima TaxID=126957 RepID=T1ITB2_STRMM